MSFLRILEELRRHWIVCSLLFIAPIAFAFVVASTATPTYRATARSLVSFQSLSGDATTVYQGAQFAAQRVQSYVGLVDSPDVLEPVVTALDLDVSATQLARQIEVNSPPGTTLLDVQVTDTDNRRAAETANSVATNLGSQIENWEKQGTRGSPVVVDLVVPATDPRGPIWPRKGVMLMLAGLAGVALAVLAAALLGARADGLGTRAPTARAPSAGRSA